MISRPSVQASIQPPIAVNTPFDRTWDAAVSWFAERNLAVTTIDKSSGLIVVKADTVGLGNKKVEGPKHGKDYSAAITFADCGSRDGVPYDPTAVTYNVHIVREGDISRFQGNVKYEQDGHGVGNKYYVCQSTGKWEKEIQAFVKERAERK